MSVLADEWDMVVEPLVRLSMSAWRAVDPSVAGPVVVWVELAGRFTSGRVDRRGLGGGESVVASLVRRALEGRAGSFDGWFVLDVEGVGVLVREHVLVGRRARASARRAARDENRRLRSRNREMMEGMEEMQAAVPDQLAAAARVLEALQNGHRDGGRPRKGGPKVGPFGEALVGLVVGIAKGATAARQASAAQAKKGFTAPPGETTTRGSPLGADTAMSSRSPAKPRDVKRKQGDEPPRGIRREAGAPPPARSAPKSTVGTPREEGTAPTGANWSSGSIFAGLVPAQEDPGGSEDGWPAWYEPPPEEETAPPGTGWSPGGFYSGIVPREEGSRRGGDGSPASLAADITRPRRGGGGGPGTE